MIKRYIVALHKCLAYELFFFLYRVIAVLLVIQAGLGHLVGREQQDKWEMRGQRESLVPLVPLDGLGNRDHQAHQEVGYVVCNSIDLVANMPWSPCYVLF